MQIKKKHDEEKKLGNEKQEELEQIKKEIEQLEVQEINAEGPQFEMESRLSNLREELSATKYKTQEEEMTKYSYYHMLDRMKKDFIASKLMSSMYDSSLKNK